MSTLFGLVAAAISSFLTLQVSNGAFGNAGGPGTTARVVLVGLAALGAFMVGSAAYRRARRTHESLGLFTALAFSFPYGAVGCAFMVALTAVYLSGYGSGGSTAADAALTVLAYPALGVTGLCLGAAGGWIVGLVASGALRVLAPAPR
jgi:hypothetical protein